MSADERTGWRDQAYSKRHRTWGYDTPTLDIDSTEPEPNETNPAMASLWVEYDNFEPLFYVSLKRGNAPDNDNEEYTYWRVGDAAGKPVVVVHYYPSEPGPWRFSVRCLTETPISSRPWPAAYSDPWECEEPDYVDFLYRLRGRRMPGWPALHVGWLRTFLQENPEIQAHYLTR